MPKYKIGCLTYKKLDFLTRKAIEKINDPELELFTIEGVREELSEKVNDALSSGTDVFVAGSANAEYINRTTTASIVKIRLSAADYIEALFNAIKIGKKIAIVSYLYEPRFDFSRFEEYLSVNLCHIEYSETHELEMKLKEADVDVVVGASLSNEIAGKLGIESVLIYPGESAIISAIMEAKELAAALRKERERSKFIQAIVDFSPIGIVLTDETGKIIIFNHLAEKIMGLNSQKVRGNIITSIIPELKLDEIMENGLPQSDIISEMGGNKILAKCLSIEDGGMFIGILAMLSPESAIYETHKKIQMLSKEKGFIAKSNFKDIIGKSNIIKQTIYEAKLFARADSNILIYGETGVGKEIFAQSIHNYSYRKAEPFVAINCSALPENLLESELFGYDEGAFTGSRKGGKPGLFEIANGGTLLLDEIGELSLPLQSRLLRVLQEKEVMRVGGSRVIPVDVRIISATNKKP